MKKIPKQLNQHHSTPPKIGPTPSFMGSSSRDDPPILGAGGVDGKLLTMPSVTQKKRFTRSILALIGPPRDLAHHETPHTST